MEASQEGHLNASIVSEKGWVVIPEELRKKYGIKKGDRVRIVDYGGVLSIVPASSNPIQDSMGMSKGASSLVKALVMSRREDAAADK